MVFSARKAISGSKNVPSRARKCAEKPKPRRENAGRAISREGGQPVSAGRSPGLPPSQQSPPFPARPSSGWSDRFTRSASSAGRTLHGPCAGGRSRRCCVVFSARQRFLGAKTCPPGPESAPRNQNRAEKTPAGRSAGKGGNRSAQGDHRGCRGPSSRPPSLPIHHGPVGPVHQVGVKRRSHRPVVVDPTRGRSLGRLTPTLRLDPPTLH